MNRWIVPLALSLAAAGCVRATDDVSSAPAPAAAPRTETVTAQPAVAPSESSPAAPRDPVTDSIITARIKTGILADPGMAGSDVSVNTDHGVVSLRGTIKSQEQAAIASSHAQRPDGVMRVDNQLAVNLH